MTRVDSSDLEPSSFGSSSQPRFLVGQDMDGRWVVADVEGKEGGLFINREAAIKFATSLTGRRRDAMVQSPSPLRLWRK